MALMHIEFFSDVMGLSTSIDVIVPQQTQNRIRMGGSNSKPPYPVLYLLHGGSGNHTNWQRNTSIERYVEDMGLVVVMPSVQYSFYSDQEHGFKYFTYLAEELPNIIKEFFHVSDKKEDTFAAGLSMGGYGAFKLGIVHPEKYAAIASLSGSISQRSRLTKESNMSNVIMQKMVYDTFGSLEQYDNSVNDLHYMLEKQIADGVELPKFYQAFGTVDHNYQVNVAFKDQFRDKIDLVYEEVPERGHDWTFWDEYIQKVLKWLPLRK